MNLRPIAVLFALSFAAPVLAQSPRLAPSLLDAPVHAQGKAGYDPAPATPTKRASQFSAGPGGPLLILNQTVFGGIAGGVAGAPYGREATFGGAVIGGLLLGGAGAVYQYYVPVGQNTALLSTIAATGGLLAGIGINSYANLENSSLLAAMLLGTSQLGALAAYAAGYGVPDISIGDFGLTALSGAYSTLFSLLFVQAMGGRSSDYRPVLFTPAVGLVIGGLLSTVVELEPGRLLKMVGIPMLTGAALYYTGVLVAGNDTSIVPAVAAVGMAVALGLTVVFTSEPGPAVASAGSPKHPAFAPTLVLASTRQNGPLTAGPGLVGTF